jgi:kynurenine formamidase
MKNKIIDLTQILNEQMTVYPGTPGPQLEVLNTVEKDGFSEYMLKIVSHTGTHIDAPCHVLKNAKSIDQFPVDKFIGSAIVIPCQDQKVLSLEFLQKYRIKFLRLISSCFLPDGSLNGTRKNIPEIVQLSAWMPPGG